MTTAKIFYLRHGDHKYALISIRNHVGELLHLHWVSRWDHADQS